MIPSSKSDTQTITTTEDTFSICGNCGGTGQQYAPELTSGVIGCRVCHGSGRILTKRVVKTEIAHG